MPPTQQHKTITTNRQRSVTNYIASCLGLGHRLWSSLLSIDPFRFVRIEQQSEKKKKNVHNTEERRKMHIQKGENLVPIMKWKSANCLHIILVKFMGIYYAHTKCIGCIGTAYKQISATSNMRCMVRWHVHIYVHMQWYITRSFIRQYIVVGRLMRGTTPRYI